jgi:hypothetical protein
MVLQWRLLRDGPVFLRSRLAFLCGLNARRAFGSTVIGCGFLGGNGDSGWPGSGLPGAWFDRDGTVCRNARDTSSVPAPHFGSLSLSVGI